MSALAASSSSDGSQPRAEDILPARLLREHRRLLTDLKRRRTRGAYDVALATVENLKRVVGGTRWRRASEIIDTVKVVGADLMRAQPVELSAGNIVRRVLHVIREEYRGKLAAARSAKPSSSSSSSSSSSISSTAASAFDDEDAASSVPASARALAAALRQRSPSPVMSPSALHKSASTLDLRIATSTPSEKKFGSVEIKGMKSEVIGAIDEIIEELKDRISPIASLANDHIHNNDVILTCGYSTTLCEFFKKAGRDRLRFQVFVAELAPSFAGHRMVRDLAAAGIEATAVTDSAVFALMAGVNKVIVPCHAVMANGGIVAKAGTHAICTAAKHHRCPVICVGGLYKLSPLYPHDQDALTSILSPSEVMTFKDCTTISLERTEVINPQFDYCPPALMDLFVTNVPIVPTQNSGGGHQPSYIYRFLADYYSPEDYEI
jgi:translation initiation factor eIF-2B subunit beta